MCVYVDARSVYCTLAEILDSRDNLSFASLMVQVLNMILFTATELYELRMQLKDLRTQVEPFSTLELHGTCRWRSVASNPSLPQASLVPAAR